MKSSKRVLPDGREVNTVGMVIDATTKRYVSVPIEKRLLAKIEKLGSGCWEWRAHRLRNGYGWISHRLAHRVSYELFKGPIPSKMTLDHLCRNRACVNPDHLEIVTRGENVLRGIGITAHNKRKEQCDRGHEYTPENTRIRGKWRACRICQREAQRVLRARKRVA